MVEGNSLPSPFIDIGALDIRSQSEYTCVSSLGWDADDEFGSFSYL